MSVEQTVALVTGILLAGGALFDGRRACRRGDGPVTALSLFLVVWSAALLLFAIPWVRYTHSSWTTWLAIYGSIATFTGGALIGSRMSPAERSPQVERISLRRLRWAWLGCFVLGVIGFADFVYAVNRVVGWHELFNNPAVVRGIQTTSATFRATYGGLKLLTYFSQVAFLLWTLGLRIGALRGRWRVAAVFGWLSLVPFIFTGDRTLILTGLIWTVLFHFVWRPPAFTGRLVVGLLCGMVTMVALFGVLGSRVSKTIESHPEIASQLTTHSFGSLALPYVYFTANVPALNQLTKDPIRPHTYGKMTFLPLVKIAHQLGVGGTPPEEVGAFYPIPFETFNNFSWIGSFYMDFGLAGCLLLPALVGWAATRLTLAAVRRRKLWAIWLASLALYVVAFSPLLNKLSTTLTWEYAFLGAIAVVFLRESPTPRAWASSQIARLRAVRPMRRATAVAVVAILVTTTVLRSRQTPASATPLAIKAELVHAEALARLTRRSGRYPTAGAVAARLHVNQPAYLFVASGDPDSRTPSPGVIGVYTNGSLLVLRSSSVSGMVEQVAELPPPRLDSNVLAGKNLLSDASFSLGFGAWFSVYSSGVTLTTQSDLGPEVHGGVVIVGHGTQLTTAVVVTQLVTTLPTAARSYTLKLLARRSGLSRRVESSIKLLLADGTYKFAIVHRLGVRHSAEGIPAGTSSGWERYGVRVQTGKPIVGVRVFAVDLGTKALSGKLRIAALRLEAH